MQIDKEWLANEIASIRQQQHATVQAALVNALSILNQAAGAETALAAVLNRLEQAEPPAEGDESPPKEG